MILFKEEHVQPILRGDKTQTRRLGKKRWNIGAVHLAKIQMLSKFYFTKLLIQDVRQERLGDITLEDAKKEGYDSIEEYKDVWIWINKEWDPELIVWVVDFELAYTDLKIGDIVSLSPECAEHTIHGDAPFKVLSDPWWVFGNEMIAIESDQKYYGAFAVEFLEKVEAAG